MPKIKAARTAMVPSPLAREHALANFSLHVGDRLAYRGSNGCWFAVEGAEMVVEVLLAERLVTVVCEANWVNDASVALSVACCAVRFVSGMAVVVVVVVEEDMSL